MRKGKFLQLALFLTLTVLLAAGCAKKPAPPNLAAPAKPQAPAATQEQPATQGTSNIQEQAVTEAPAAQETAPQPKAAVGLQRIHFDFDRFTLSPAAQGILASNAAYLKAHPAVKIVIQGYCDERGSDEYNLALGQRRAVAAKNYLVSLGIAADRLSTISYGEEYPLDPAHNETAWAKNRRDEFKIVP